MKATGIVRKLDSLGRVVLPMELRKTFDINEDDPLEIFVDGDSVVLKKYEPACLLCGDAKDVISHKEKKICKQCIKQL